MASCHSNHVFNQLFSPSSVMHIAVHILAFPFHTAKIIDLYQLFFLSLLEFWNVHPIQVVETDSLFTFKHLVNFHLLCFGVQQFFFLSL